jgi:hypothetical protein
LRGPVLFFALALFGNGTRTISTTMQCTDLIGSTADPGACCGSSLSCWYHPFPSS